MFDRFAVSKQTMVKVKIIRIKFRHLVINGRLLPRGGLAMFKRPTYDSDFCNICSIGK